MNNAPKAAVASKMFRGASRLWPLLSILAVAAALRIWYAAGLPLSGDEVGVAVLQASGQAVTYAERLSGGIVSREEVQALIAHDPAYTPRDVLWSLREAGMHPPLYYVLLHYLLRIFGNDGGTLRAVSIVMSVGAVAALFGLARALSGEAVGRCAAAMLAVLPYGVIYGSLVRPYPMAMLLSLASTLLAVRLARQGLSSRAQTYGLYLVVSAAGLYAIYQYVFVFVFQLVFLGLVHRRTPRTVAVVAFGAGVVAVAYLPWLPTLRVHVSAITRQQYYFHRELDLWRAAVEVIPHALTGFAGEGPGPGVILIAVPFFAGFIIGVAAALKGDRVTRAFLLALAAYSVPYLGSERWLAMSTVIEPKFLFFAVPIVLFFAALGLLRLSDPPRRAAVAAWGAVGVLTIHSIVMCADRAGFEGAAEEVYVRDFTPILNRAEPASLLVVNTLQRRYLFPLVHTLHGGVDVYVMREGETVPFIPEEMVARYRRLFIANLHVDYEPHTFLSIEKIAALSEALQGQRFALVDAVASGRGTPRHSLLVYDRDAPIVTRDAWH